MPAGSSWRRRVSLLFSGLGLWQLERARVKEQLLARFAAARAAPPLPWAEAESEARRRRRGGAAAADAGSRGASMRPGCVYHDHRVEEGRPGLHALAVFRPGGREARAAGQSRLGGEPARLARAGSSRPSRRSSR
ncbi:MAG: SURF1 family cytochrome oxidase biogenesis protein [Xanthomonadales bacterium]|nr:SURF1 family cytochrome oxidase biogenesis protein [Xanthomonadales bacterium]